MPDNNDWVTVASTYFLPEADVLRSVLEEHDIPVFLRGEHTSALGAPLAILDRGVRVQVPRNEQARAEQILRTVEPFEAVEDEEADAAERDSVGQHGELNVDGTSRLMWALMTGLGLAWLVLWLLLRG